MVKDDNLDPSKAAHPGGGPSQDPVPLDSESGPDPGVRKRRRNIAPPTDAARGEEESPGNSTGSPAAKIGG